MCCYPTAARNENLQNECRKYYGSRVKNNFVSSKTGQTSTHWNVQMSAAAKHKMQQRRHLDGQENGHWGEGHACVAGCLSALDGLTEATNLCHAVESDNTELIMFLWISISWNICVYKDPDESFKVVSTSTNLTERLDQLRCLRVSIGWFSSSKGATEDSL